MRTIGVLALAMMVLANVCYAADTLIYNNATLTGYRDQPGYNHEYFDYGSSSGGLISKFTIGYSCTSAMTISVRFYQNISVPMRDVGYLTKMISFDVASTGGVVQYYTYVLPEADRFQLPSGLFGYSIAFYNNTAYVVLASGGTGQANELWEYTGYEWLSFWYGGTPWAGLYMKIYSGPPIEDVTCDITGYKFNDLNGNAVKDGGEPTLPSWEFYLDANNDGVRQTSEPNVVTDPNGFYRFDNVPSPATYRVRETLKAGWTQTLPGASGSYHYLINTDPNHVYGPYYFGNTNAVIKYGGGTGTAGDPYQIETPAHMNEIGLNTADWNKYFRLENDIDMSGYTGTQYHLIGNVGTQFTGNFNGNNHVIRNLSYTTSTATYYIGLFGYTNGAAISNLGLENVNVSSAGRYIGGLVGYQFLGTVSNCYVTGGQVSGANSSRYVGGLAGYQSGTVVSNCRADVHVHSGTNSQYMGGFASQAGNLTNCYSAGAVTAGTGSLYIGGLAYTGGTMTSSYWDTEASGRPTGVGTPKTTTQMRALATFTGWNFTTTWRICAGTNYPRLAWEPVPVGDFVCPEGVTLTDALFMSDAWLMTGALEADIAPSTPDGKVDMKDFAALAGNWMEGTD